jgi:hypothetical protein
MPNTDNLLKAKDLLSAEFLTVGDLSDESWLIHSYSKNLKSIIKNAKNHIHGVGIGKKIIKNKVTEIDAITVYVTNKLPLSLLHKKHIIPKMIGKIPTDVVPMAHAIFLSCTDRRTERMETLIGGISIGHKDITSGTIGYFCHSKAQNDENIYVLSNNHILAKVNDGKIGDVIYQPSNIYDSKETVATLTDFVKLDENILNNVDAAIGKLIYPDDREDLICTIGKITGTESVYNKMEVLKHGAESGLTRGQVASYLTDIKVCSVEYTEPFYRVFKFVNQIVVVGEKVVKLGDSGSLVVNALSKKAVGLLFAGDPNGSYYLANHIDKVEDQLNIKLLV